jgi:hypothetical protein
VQLPEQGPVHVAQLLTPGSVAPPPRAELHGCSAERHPPIGHRAGLVGVGESPRQGGPCRCPTEPPRPVSSGCPDGNCLAAKPRLRPAKQGRRSVHLIARMSERELPFGGHARSSPPIPRRPVLPVREERSLVFCSPRSLFPSDLGKHTGRRQSLPVPLVQFHHPGSHRQVVFLAGLPHRLPVSQHLTPLWGPGAT